jgi:hypothetical protein
MQSLLVATLLMAVELTRFGGRFVT